MANTIVTPDEVTSRVAKGDFKPHTALSNMALAYYQDDKNYFAKSIFPICKVDLSSDNYYIFNKEDLLRDNWQRKPAYGSVVPAVLSEHMDQYACRVDQMIMGIDKIRQTDLLRRGLPATANPRIQRVKAIAAQANIHQDAMFATKFMNAAAWGNTWQGKSTTPGAGQFYQFDNGNSDPIKFIDDRKTEIQQSTGRMPNKIVLGIDVFNALKLHAGILERIKYGGTTANPAQVTENVLAQLFGVQEVHVLKSIMNKADFGATPDMDFIADSKSLLLAYATDAPSIEEPSAGYIFSWDMLGDGNILPIQVYDGAPASHSEYVEGLMATDMRKTGDDLACFCYDVVG